VTSDELRVMSVKVQYKLRGTSLRVMRYELPKVGRPLFWTAGPLPADYRNVSGPADWIK
jgi:hypothetical protein